MSKKSTKYDPEIKLLQKMKNSKFQTRGGRMTKASKNIISSSSDENSSKKRLTHGRIQKNFGNALDALRNVSLRLNSMPANEKNLLLREKNSTSNAKKMHTVAPLASISEKHKANSMVNSSDSLALVKVPASRKQIVPSASVLRGMTGQKLHMVKQLPSIPLQLPVMLKPDSLQHNANSSTLVRSSSTKKQVALPNLIGSVTSLRKQSLDNQSRDASKKIKSTSALDYSPNIPSSFTLVASSTAVPSKFAKPVPSEIFCVEEDHEQESLSIEDPSRCVIIEEYLDAECSELHDREAEVSGRPSSTLTSLITEMLTRMETLESTNKDLIDQNRALMSQNQDLVKQLDELTGSVDALREQVVDQHNHGLHVFGKTLMDPLEGYPLKTLEEFDELESNNGNDRRKKLCKRILEMGADKLRLFVVFAFEQTMVESLVMEFTWKGIKNKSRGLIRTKWINDLYLTAYACTYFYGPININDFSQHVSEVLRCIKQRYKSRLERMERISNPLEPQNSEEYEEESDERMGRNLNGLEPQNSEENEEEGDKRMGRNLNRLEPQNSEEDQKDDDDEDDEDEEQNK